jgi:P4 family phage/plasmid primase-like protien
VKDATRDINAFKALIGDRERFNLGIATGSASGVIVIDIDPRNGGDEGIATLEGKLGPLPATLTAITGGGGRHFYFQNPDKGGLKKTILAPGVDLLGEGSYAVAPPSKHATGRRYHWKPPAGLRRAIAELPDAWIAFARRKTTASLKHSEPAPSNAISKGERNTELTRIAGQLRRTGLLQTELLVALRAVNQKRCRPPLVDREIAQIATSVGKYPVASQTQDPALRIAEQLLNAEFGGGEWLRQASDEYFWSWRGTHWCPLPDRLLQQKILGAVTGSGAGGSARAQVHEVFGLLKIMQARSDDPLHLTSEPPNVINVANGELWLLNDGGVELRPHNPETGMRHVLNVRYDADATCPEYDAALKGIFAKAKYPATLASFFNEQLGYTLQQRRNIPLVLVMIGDGSNGKTSLVKLLIELVGTDFVYSGRVDELESGRFAIGSLFGKLVFIDDDVRAGAKLPDGTLKKISEAKLLTGEHKFKPAFSFLNRAFPILLCNNRPSLADLSPGMMRRLHVLPFDRRFDENEVDQNLFQRISANELSGVLNRALEGWARLQKRGRFPKSMDMDRARQELLIHANPLKGFIHERCEKRAGAKIELKSFYEAYFNWAETSGYTMRQAKSTVQTNLRHEGYELRRHGAGLMVIGLRLRPR